MKAAPIPLLAILLTFTASPAWAAIGPPLPPSAPPLPPVAETTALAHLATAQLDVKQALDSLAQAAISTHGGYVEKAVTDVNKTADDLTQASAYVNAHPEINFLPAGPASAETSNPSFAPVPAKGRGGPAQPRMVAAITDLNAALGEFVNPTASNYHGSVIGDLGGFRQKIMDDIGHANADILAGIAYTDGSGGATVPSASIADAARTDFGYIPPLPFMVPVGKNNSVSIPPEYHGETAELRLLALQSSLNLAVKDLRQVPTDPHGGFVETVLDELSRAQAGVELALEYVRAHPESNWLQAIPTRAGMPGLAFRIQTGFASIYRPNLLGAYANLSVVAKSMDAYFLNLILGPYPGTSAIIGDLGGYRDEIMHHICQASADIVAGAEAIIRAGAPGASPDARLDVLAQAAAPPATGRPDSPPLSTPSVPIHVVVASAGTSTAKPGSISGIVVDRDGLAANVLIACQITDNMLDPPAGSIRFASIPMTITDDRGAFTVKDLPPGSYLIDVSRTYVGRYSQGASTQSIEVKEGAETTLPAPIVLQVSPF